MNNSTIKEDKTLTPKINSNEINESVNSPTNCELNLTDQTLKNYYSNKQIGEYDNSITMIDKLYSEDCDFANNNSNISTIPDNFLQAKAPQQENSLGYIDSQAYKEKNEDLTNKAEDKINQKQNSVYSNRNKDKLKTLLISKFKSEDLIYLITKKVENKVLQSLLIEASNEIIEEIYNKVSLNINK